jgi:hypothetical protein
MGGGGAFTGSGRCSDKVRCPHLLSMDAWILLKTFCLATPAKAGPQNVLCRTFSLLARV